MRQVQVWVSGVAIGVAGGLAIGMLLFSGGGEELAPQDSLARAGGAPVVNPATDAPSGAPAAESHDPARSIVASSPATADALTPLAGDGVIDGCVTDPTGRPLAGVIVRAAREMGSRTSSRRGHEGEEWPSLDEEIQRTIADHQRQTQGRRQTTTDGEGRYRFDGLARGSYRLTAALDGYELQSRNGLGQRVPVGSTVNWRASPLFEVAVQVRLADGRSADRALLKVVAGPTATTEEWHAEDPPLRFVSGSYELSASIDADLATQLGCVEQAAPPQTIHVSAELKPSALLFELEVRRGIRGRVVLADDTPAESVIVRHQLLAHGSAAEPDRFANGGDGIWVAAWNAHQFAIYDLPAGRYRVSAFAGDSERPLVSEVVEVADAMVECVLRASAPSADDLLIARVTGPDGLALPSVEFSMISQIGSFTSTSEVNAQSTDAGSYRILLTAEAKDVLDGAGTLVLSAGHKSFGEVSQQLASGQREVALRFGPPASLLVSALGYVGSGVDGRLWCQLVADESASSPITARRSFGPDGTATLGPVAPGSYVIVLSVESGRSSMLGGDAAVHEQPLLLAAGDNRIAIAVPQLYVLTVRFPPDEDLGQALLTAEANGRNRSAAIEQGIATFRDVAAGDYRIQSWRGAGSMRIRIPAQLEVEFAVEAIDALRVHIIDPSGSFAEAGMQDGDLVIAINGVAFADEAELAMAWGSSMGGKDAVLTVLRNGGEVKVTIDMQAALKGDVGASLLPTSR